VSKYSFKNEKLPKRFHSPKQEFATRTHSILNSNGGIVEGVYEGILLPEGRGWGVADSNMGIDIVLFGSFYSDYNVIAKYAEMLSIYEDIYGFMPKITPLKERIWFDFIAPQKEKVGIFKNKGIVSFNNEIDL
jgi:hypothetical protein